MEQLSSHQNSLPASPDPHIIDPLPLCNHIYPKGRHCRQAVAGPNDLFCASHAHRPQAATFSDPLADLADELTEASEIHHVKSFLAKVIRLACQNRISMSRATALTFMANSLLNAIRLANQEERLAAKDDDDDDRYAPHVDFTGFPRPIRNLPPIDEQPPSNPDQVLSSADNLACAAGSGFSSPDTSASSRGFCEMSPVCAAGSQPQASPFSARIDTVPRQT